MDNKTFVSFVSPSVIIMLVLMVFPLVTAIVLGFNYITFQNFADPVFVGLQNYKELLADSAFWGSLKFTLIYIVFTVPVQITIGFLVALLLDQVERFRGVYIAASLLPFVVTPVVGTLMFRSLFDRGGGLFYYLLDVLFNYEFFMTTTSVRLLIILQGIWYTTPFSMITLFAGLQTLPKSAMEAATVDGANAFHKLWYVVLPHLRSLFVFIGMIAVMDAYRVFDNILVMTKDNPAFNADTIMYYNFKMAISFGRQGKANAMSILTIFGIFIVLIPFLRTTYKQQMEKR